MRILLDSCVIISFFVADEHTQKAEQVFVKIFNGNVRAFVTPLVLAEVCGAIRRNNGKEKAKFVLKELQSWLSKDLLDFIGSLGKDPFGACFLAVEYGVKGADALIAITAKQHELSFVTFDTKLKEKIKDEVVFYE